MSTVSKRFEAHPYFTKFVAFFLGCLFCFLLQRHLGFSNIFAASVLGVLVTFVPIPERLNPKGIQIAFCTGTFAGMSSAQLISSPLDVLAVSVIGTIIYFLAKPHFTGFGGKMGAIAFVSIMLWLLVRVYA